MPGLRKPGSLGRVSSNSKNVNLRIRRISNVIVEFPNIGAWYNVNDTSTVFQDALATVPSSFNDTIGSILDKNRGEPGPNA